MTKEIKMETYNFNDTGNTVTNAEDRFLNMTTEQIKAELLIGRSQMVNVCMNLTSDFNKSSIIRSNNAFLGKEVILVGKRRFDRRGTTGVHHYETLKHSVEIETVIEYLRENSYKIFAVDNIADYNPKAVYDVDMPEKTAFVYGEESNGLSREIIDMCDEMVYIPQYGSVRSVNVAQAASIMMSEYNRRHRTW